MDAKAIETLAIGAVKDSVVVSDFMDQFISDNDKEPSWDGNVYIYKGKGKKRVCCAVESQFKSKDMKLMTFH